LDVYSGTNLESWLMRLFNGSIGLSLLNTCKTTSNTNNLEEAFRIMNLMTKAINKTARCRIATSIILLIKIINSLAINKLLIREISIQCKELVLRIKLCQVNMIKKT